MTYFRNFPVIEYTINDEIILITNIFKRLIIRRDFFDNPERFFEYDIQDGETPEMIADKLYGNPELAFIVLMSNRIHNVFEEWPMDSNSLNRYINDKYGVNGKSDIKHYKDKEGKIVGSDSPAYNKFPVTFAEWEREQNDSKKKIRLIVSNYVEQIKKDVRDLSKA